MMYFHLSCISNQINFISSNIKFKFKQMSDSLVAITPDFISQLCSHQEFQNHLKEFFITESKNYSHCQHNVITQYQGQLQHEKQDVFQGDAIMSDLTDLLIKNFKQSVYKESNDLYAQIFTIMAEIDKIKQHLKDNPQNKRSDTEHIKESVKRNSSGQSKEHTNKTQSGANTSMFLDIESEIEGGSKKNFEFNSLSFLNSFSVNQEEGQKKEDEIDEKINSSLSKMESSMGEKLVEIQKNFQRRIEQMMKTIKNLISLMEQNNVLCSNDENQKKDGHRKLKTESAQQYSTPKKPMLESPLIKDANKDKKSLNSSYNKLTSFFKRGS